ncbi:MAG: S8 family serine peptidase [Candidatus Limnocylindria bacterium]
MTFRLTKLSVTALLTIVLCALPVAAALANGPRGSTQSADGAPAVTGANLERAVVLLNGEPVATATGQVSGPAADAYRAQLAQRRAEYTAWLAANVPQARVIWEFDTVLNGVSVALRGASAAAVAAGPHVRQVLHPTWMSPTMDTSLRLVRWDVATGFSPDQSGVPVGQGVFVGVIDSGIDHTHPFFDDDVVSLADGKPIYKNPDGSCTFQPIGDTRFTNCKVVVAKVFHPDTSLTAQAINSHGTHVAGTVGGNSGTDSPTGKLSGAAPGAFLGSYNVFPGDTGSASSDDIAVAVEAAVLDGMDVLNLSLGGTPRVKQYDALDLALKSAADVGVLAAVAAGNSGPGAATIQSPGWAPWVLTAGASTNPHFLGQTALAETLGETGAAVGDFAAFPSPAITLPFVWWDTIDGRGTGEACENRPLRGVNLDGKIALIGRGTCAFTTKIRNAQAINAEGVIVFNNVAGDPIAMGHDGTDPFPAIPAVMVSQTYGTAMTALSGKNVTVGGAIEEKSGTADILAGFSSRGPADTPDGLLIKPDMAAPGVNVHSSVVCTGSDGCGFALFQGTSMATPHLAGSAAALMWQRGWAEAFATRDEQVKSILVNTAADGVIKDHVSGTATVGVMDEGAGRLDVANAFAATFTGAPVSFSFGAVAGGATAVSRSVTLTGEAGATYTATVTQPSLSGVTATVSVSGSTVTVTLARPRGTRGDAEGTVTVSDGSRTIHLAYWARF